MPRLTPPSEALPLEDAPRDGTAVRLWGDVWGWTPRVHRWRGDAWTYGRGTFANMAQRETHFRLATPEEIDLDESGPVSRLRD